MKVIRAKENLWVPQDPETPSKDQGVKLVSAGRCALVPSDFREGSFEVVSTLNESKGKNKK